MGYVFSRGLLCTPRNHRQNFPCSHQPHGNCRGNLIPPVLRMARYTTPTPCSGASPKFSFFSPLYLGKLRFRSSVPAGERAALLQVSTWCVAPLRRVRGSQFESLQSTTRPGVFDQVLIQRCFVTERRFDCEHEGGIRGQHQHIASCVVPIRAEINEMYTLCECYGRRHDPGEVVLISVVRQGVRHEMITRLRGHGDMRCAPSQREDPIAYPVVRHTARLLDNVPFPYH